MFGVLELVLTIDEDIVEVGGIELVEISLEGFVNIALKRSRTVI